MADWIKRLPCMTCLPKLSDPLATCEIAPTSNRCSTCHAGHKKCRPVPDSPELQRILGLRGLIYYGGILGHHDLEARQTELNALVKDLQQDIHQQKRNGTSPSVEKKTRTATRNASITRTMRQFAKERQRTKTMVCIRVPRLSRRRMREYKLIKADMIGMGRDEDMPNPGDMDIATQDLVREENTDWVDNDVDHVDNMETREQDPMLVDGINRNPSDNQDGDEQASFFDEEQHRREQFDEVRKMLDAMVRRSLRRNFLRPVSAPETQCEVSVMDIKPFGSLISSDTEGEGDNVDHKEDLCGWPIDGNVWGLDAELIGEVKEEREIPAKGEGNEDNIPVNMPEISNQDKTRQKAKQAKMKRKAERAERGLRLKKDEERMAEQKGKALIQASKRKSSLTRKNGIRRKSADALPAK